MNVFFFAEYVCYEVEWCSAFQYWWDTCDPVYGNVGADMSHSRCGQIRISTIYK